jgi:hypothetical protein
MASIEIGDITISAGRSLPAPDHFSQGPVGVRITDSSVVFYDKETDDHILVVSRPDIVTINALMTVPGLPHVVG